MLDIITSLEETPGCGKLKHVFLQSGTNIPKNIDIDNVLVVDLIFEVTTPATREALGIPRSLRDATRPENFSLPTDPLPRDGAPAIALRKQRAVEIRKTMWDTLFLTERKPFVGGIHEFDQGMKTDGEILLCYAANFIYFNIIKAVAVSIRKSRSVVVPDNNEGMFYLLQNYI